MAKKRDLASEDEKIVAVGEVSAPGLADEAAAETKNEIVPMDVQEETPETEEKAAFFPSQHAPAGIPPQVPVGEAGNEEDPAERKRRLRARLLDQLAALEGEEDKQPASLPEEAGEEDPAERRRRLREQIQAQLAELEGEEEAPTDIPGEGEEEAPEERRRRLLRAQMATLNTEGDKQPPVALSDTAPEDEEDPAERKRKLRERLLAQLAELDAEEEGKMVEVDGDMRFRLESLRGPLPGSAKMVEIDSDMPGKLRELRRNRLASMGVKEEEIEGLVDKGYICATSRKVMGADEPTCDFCRGGCQRDKGLPGLLDIEAIAQDHYKGIVLNSGYAASDDTFVVDLKCEDGELIEAMYSGEGKTRGWVPLDKDAYANVDEKVLREGRKVISRTDAQDIATKQIPGAVVKVEAAIFEGYDVYAVEIDGVNSKSYDAYVALDGTLIAYDEYPEGVGQTEDEETLRAIAAEAEMKRAYATTLRKELADAGVALPDGSFVIADEGDLRNAILAVGRAVNPPLAKAHTIKRAIELELDSLIPDEWIEDKSGELPDTDEKRFVSAEDREKYSKQGIALPDGSFPIANETDLRAAIHAVGRAKDTDRAKAHIRKRARALGLEHLLGPGILGREKVMVDGEEDPSALASLMEFELLEQEEEMKDILDQ